MTGKNPGKHGVYGFTDVKPGTMSIFFPNFGNVARRHAVGRRGAGGQALHRAEHPEHVSGAARCNGLLVSGFVAVNLERAVYPPELLPRLKADGYRIDVDYVNADQRPDALLHRPRRRRSTRAGGPTSSWCATSPGTSSSASSPSATACTTTSGTSTSIRRRRITSASSTSTGGSTTRSGELVAALPADIPLFVVADHGHTLIHRECLPNAWLRDAGAAPVHQREAARGRPTSIRRPRCSSSIPGRIYLHRKGRFPLGTVDDAEAPDAPRAGPCGACSRCATTVRARRPADVRCRASSRATSSITAAASTRRPTS